MEITKTTFIKTLKDVGIISEDTKEFDIVTYMTNRYLLRINKNLIPYVNRDIIWDKLIKFFNKHPLYFYPYIFKYMLYSSAKNAEIYAMFRKIYPNKPIDQMFFTNANTANNLISSFKIKNPLYFNLMEIEDVSVFDPSLPKINITDYCTMQRIKIVFDKEISTSELRLNKYLYEYINIGNRTNYSKLITTTIESDKIDNNFINDNELYINISKYGRKILTDEIWVDYVFNGYNQTELATKYNVVPSTIYNKLLKMRSVLNKHQPAIYHMISSKYAYSMEDQLWGLYHLNNIDNNITKLIDPVFKQTLIDLRINSIDDYMANEDQIVKTYKQVCDSRPISNIERLRIANGLTQEELARLAGIATRTVQRYEKGDVTPNHSYLHKLADVLNVSVKDL